MTNIVAHPRLTQALNDMPHKIAADRNKGIAHLEFVIKNLKRAVKVSGYGKLENLIAKFETAYFELQTLDPAAPPSARAVGALGRRLEDLHREISGCLDAPIPTPPSSTENKAEETEGD